MDDRALRIINTPDDALRTYLVGDGRLRWLAAIWIVSMLAVAVLHSPGQMSVDTGVALYEGAIGRAVGWGPTFFAALLSWLGGNVVGTSLFVGANILAIFGSFFFVLTRGANVAHVARMRPWQLVIGTLVSLNPIFLLYAGILWKDVLLATLAMVSVAGLLALERDSSSPRVWLACLVVVPLAAMPLVRQQGILIALPLWVVLAAIVARHWRKSLIGRLVVMGVVFALLFASMRALDHASAATITPLPASPTATGINTVMSYDILGMTALSDTGEPARSDGASDAVIEAIRSKYSHERIDTAWHVPVIRDYMNSMDRERLRTAWWAGVTGEPGAYLRHRAAAMGALLGFGSMRGCVPGYWGVAAPSDYLHALSIHEEMDGRDRVIGRITLAISESPILRNWTYLVLLIVSTAAVFRHRRNDDRLATVAGLTGAWLYFASYLPTTIACDLRYLYPVASLATIVAIHLLTRSAAPETGEPSA